MRPPILSPGRLSHPLELAPRVLCQPSVSVVLRPRAEAQVFFSVVGSIVIFVVHPSALRGIEDKPPNRDQFALNSSSDPCISFVSINVPTIVRDSLGVFRVNLDCVIAADYVFHLVSVPQFLPISISIGIDTPSNPSIGASIIFLTFHAQWSTNPSGTSRRKLSCI